MPSQDSAWVFIGEGTRLPSGVFSSRERAEEWIRRHGLSGMLTAYPLDRGVYDWATQTGQFRPKTAEHETPTFVGRFTSAALEHTHYVEGSQD